MVIFNSYVSLPEGKHCIAFPSWWLLCSPGYVRQIPLDYQVRGPTLLTNQHLPSSSSCSSSSSSPSSSSSLRVIIDLIMTTLLLFKKHIITSSGVRSNWYIYIYMYEWWSILPLHQHTTGWWYTYPSFKKIMEFVSWDDDIPLFPRYGKSLKDKTLFQSPPTRLLLTIINTY